jgi:hypothetical protein
MRMDAFIVTSRLILIAALSVKLALDIGPELFDHVVHAPKGKKR